MHKNYRTVLYTPEESKILVRARGVPTNRLVRHLVELVRREVRGVSDGPEVWNKWRIDLSDGLPVHAIEEGVVLNLVHIEAMFL